jgi:hypothetical protein
MPRIGLVGSSKAGTRGFEDVSQIVEYWMDLTQQSHEEIEFVSGGGVGIDATARSVCKKFEVDFKEFKPDGIGWQEFKKRNLQIAEYCDKVIESEVLITPNTRIPYITIYDNDGNQHNIYEGWFEEAYPIKKLQLKRTPGGFRLCNIE